MNVGDKVEFEYKGYVETWVVPENGWYLLEGWGAQGGQAFDYAHWEEGAVGGKGGYAKGCAKLKKNQTIYVAVAGAGNRSNSTSQFSGGFNGGGNAIHVGSNYCWVGSGGGATHIALVNGLLKDIGYESFVTSKNGLLVAGGGSGSAFHKYASAKTQAGRAGGGLAGENGITNEGGTAGRYPIGKGGTQTFGYAFGLGGGGDTYNDGGRLCGSCGGGGGLYGGEKGIVGDSWWAYSIGGGGSSFIGNLESWGDYSPNTIANVQDGNGYARITLLEKKSLELYLGGLSIEGLALGDIEIQNIAIGDLVLS